MTTRCSFAFCVAAAAFIVIHPRSTHADTLYVSNIGDNSIARFDSSGNGSYLATFHPGPEGLTVDAAHNLYVASESSGNSAFNDTVTKFNPAGTPSIYANASAGLVSPAGLAFDNSGNLYVGNFYQNTIIKITPQGVGSVFANTGLNGPAQLAFDAAGNLYVANYFGMNVEKFTPNGASVVFASGFSNPEGLAFDAAGNLYVSNSGGNSIDKITPGGAKSLWASTGLNDPIGLAFDSSGFLYVANEGNNTIEKFNSGGVGSVFAHTDLNEPIFLAFVPEPSLGAIGLGGMIWLVRGRCALAIRKRR
jgi:sugar lactone lactonase YvrE